LTTAKPTADVLDAPRAGARWWLVAGTLFGLALAAVLGYALARFGEGRLAEGPAPIVADGADLLLVQGTARKDGSSFVLEAPAADGAAVLAAKLTPFAAREFSRVEWTIDSAQGPQLAFVWRTRENPRRTYSKPLSWLVTGAAPLSLTAEDGWSGTITGVGLVAAAINTPVSVRSLRIVSPSVIAAADGLARQWSARNPLRGYSVNYPFDAERGHDLPAVVAVAIAEAAASICCSRGGADGRATGACSGVSFSAAGCCSICGGRRTSGAKPRRERTGSPARARRKCTSRPMTRRCTR
jgi:hypothetical protein